ncbi:MAG: DUF3575 domain-containing protein [Bacteroidales bacterium]|nr:DUF3575 domain-containing protein [Bacteroidales bacterium]
MKKFITILFIFIAASAFAQEPQAGRPEQARQNQPERVRRTVRETENHASFDLSTNLFDWADFGTINVDAAYSFSRHFTAQIGAKFNGWQFKNPEGPTFLTQNQQKSVSLGVRYWPWYVYSGWWICLKGQYCDFSECGVWRQALDEGKALGAGLSFGYTIMLTEHFNLEIGAGGWGGKLLEHNLWNCPDEKDVAEPRVSGPKTFVAVNDLNISLHWLF